MAFSIKQIKAILSEHGLPVDNLDKAAEEICGRHTADLDSIKEQRDSFKKDAETLASVQKELDDLKAAGDGGWEEKAKNWEKKYNDLVADNQQREAQSAKESAYRALLQEAGVSEKRIGAVLKVTDLSKIELEDGKIKDADALKEGIKTEWADFITTETTVGAQTAAPPSNTGGSMTKDQILSIKDRSERRQAIADNMNLFTGGNE